jgi:general secretion pathway protein L
MSVLRLRCSLLRQPGPCEWALLDPVAATRRGESPLSELPRGAARVQMVIPAAEVLLTRVRLPKSVQGDPGAALAYALEDETLSEPEAIEVFRVGAAAEGQLVAVVARAALRRWMDALHAASLNDIEICGETLLLPLAAGEWSVAWNGLEGFVRTAHAEGAATDCGNADTPPLALRALIDEYRGRGAAPRAIALYASKPDERPDTAAWASALGVPVNFRGAWDWATAPAASAVPLSVHRRQWRLPAARLRRFRAAAWIAGIALLAHAGLMAADWALLAAEERSLRGRLEARFRAVFPEAVAVVDPVLQMRRKVAEARHAAGETDSADFLPMMEKVAVGARELAPGSVRAVSYESGLMTLEFANAAAPDAVEKLAQRLRQAGMRTEPPARLANGAFSLKVRPQ